MINARLIAYLSAAALAAVVLAYGLGRWQGSAAERRACEAEIHAAELTAERQARETERKAQEAQNAIVQDYEGCQTPVPVKTCPEPPALSPALSATPSPTFRERLRRVWLSPQSATKSQSDTKH